MAVAIIPQRLGTCRCRGTWRNCQSTLTPAILDLNEPTPLFRLPSTSSHPASDRNKVASTSPLQLVPANI